MDRNGRDDTSSGSDDAGDAMDELAAHLDRAWDLLERGELEAARRSIDDALALERESPEALTALGALEAMRDAPEDALVHFERAIALDPGYVDPYLHAAELLLYPLGKPEEAIEMCDAAIEAAEEEEEYLDALLLKAEAQIEMGDADEARTTPGDLPPTRLPDAQLELRAGRALLDTGDLDESERRLRSALAQSPDLTDALHALGLVCEERGDRDQMLRLFAQVRAADMAEPPPPWSIPAQRFDELAQEALASLPPALRDRLANVPVVVSDYPSAALCEDGIDPRLMGLFAGVPFPEQSVLGATPHLDTVMLFQRNIERACRSVSEVEAEIEKTLIHETGHFFGLSEEELESLGLG